MAGVEQLTELFPFDMVIFDSDCGSEFINHEVAAWLQARDIEQTRSRPYQKNDQAHVESKNNLWCVSSASIGATTPAELELLNRLWRLVRATELLRPRRRRPSVHHHRGRPQEAACKPATPWQRLKHRMCLTRNTSGWRRVDGINPAELTRRSTPSDALLDLARPGRILAAARHVDLAALTFIQTVGHTKERSTPLAHHAEAPATTSRSLLREASAS